MSNPVLVETAEAVEDKTAMDSQQLLANYQKLVSRVSDVFGSEVKASLWLSRPNKDLNGEAPIQIAMRDGYATRSLEPALTRIEHGIYY